MGKETEREQAKSFVSNSSTSNPEAYICVESKVLFWNMF